jgi:predicted kinase
MTVLSDRMKLVFLHGPPAVGKLAVARELARLTGYKLFSQSSDS